MTNILIIIIVFGLATIVIFLLMIAEVLRLSKLLNAVIANAHDLNTQNANLKIKLSAFETTGGYRPKPSVVTSSKPPTGGTGGSRK